MKQHTTISFVNDLIGVLLDNLLYYIPSELITGEVLTQMEENIPDSFFDELSLFDLEKGVFLIHNEDTLAINKKLLEKRALLENNLISLLQKRKEISPAEFEFMLQKYYDQLVFFIFITDWLVSNIKKYHKEVSTLPLIGSYKLQHEYLLNHTKEINNYFTDVIDIEKEYYFTAEKLVMEYFPDLISRYQQVTQSNENSVDDKPILESEKKEIVSDTDSEQQKIKSGTRQNKKRVGPQLDDEEIERMILTSIFKVKMDS
ncbi:hypothetical protein [Lutibacter sp.]|uniref:hypothetical protein n=1 Tax=Lutibacter sp. TaxID=1925666 RepID=UPI0035669020